MSSRLRCPLFENEERTSLCWVEYFIDRYARKSGQALQECREENSSSTSVVSLAWKYPRITERYRTFGDPLRVRHFFSIDESWLPLLLPATESKRHIDLPRRLEAQEKNMIEEALKASRGRVFGPTRGRGQVGHTAVDAGIED